MANDRFYDLTMFNSLQILEISSNESDVSKIIPYLGSKFNEDQFKKMQISLVFGKIFRLIEWENG